MLNSVHSWAIKIGVDVIESLMLWLTTLFSVYAVNFRNAK